MSIYLAKPASTIKKGNTLLALGWGDNGEKVTTVTRADGYTNLTTNAGKYKLRNDTLVNIRQPANP